MIRLQDWVVSIHRDADAAAITDITRCTQTGDLIADSMCGIGTALIEAIRLAATPSAPNTSNGGETGRRPDHLRAQPGLETAHQRRRAGLSAAPGVARSVRRQRAGVPVPVAVETAHGLLVSRLHHRPRRVTRSAARYPERRTVARAKSGASLKRMVTQIQSGPGSGRNHPAVLPGPAIHGI